MAGPQDQGFYTPNVPTVSTPANLSNGMLFGVDTGLAGGSVPQTVAVSLEQAAAGPFQILAATGATQGNAALISAVRVLVTVTASTEGVKLPAASTGKMVQVFCPGAVGVKVYPFTGDKISTASTNAAVALVADKANIYIAKDQTTWAVQRGA